MIIIRLKMKCKEFILSFFKYNITQFLIYIIFFEEYRKKINILLN